MMVNEWTPGLSGLRCYDLEDSGGEIQGGGAQRRDLRMGCLEVGHQLFRVLLAVVSAEEAHAQRGGFVVKGGIGAQ